IVPYGSAEFPIRLLVLPDPPPILWIHGALDAAEESVVGVVGARRATGYGRNVARRLGKELGSAGVVVVSGLARGVDQEAPPGAPDSTGTPWAVLGSGLDDVYPPEHRGTADRIVRSGGVLISEFPLSTPPFPAHFPRRNRIIAGLSAAVVVVE